VQFSRHAEEEHRFYLSLLKSENTVVGNNVFGLPEEEHSLYVKPQKTLPHQQKGSSV
jgi:hypothetical protein